jgi:hypothetical protein
MRQLSEIEEKRLSALTNYSVPLTIIEPTATGLGKSILDATAPVRRYLKESNHHNYDTQGQGQENKKVINGFLISETLLIPSKVSLYRPNTKKGDPRIWFKGLPSYSRHSDLIAIIGHEDTLYMLNLTTIPINEILNEQISSPLLDLVNEISRQENSIADELLNKITSLAKSGPIPALLEADTGIGRTLETVLGIPMNSKREPDYKGIELKSFRSAGRGKRENRKTLFAKVANWEHSQFKSSREILDHFGYSRGEDFKLYCTVSTQVINSQGLGFSFDSEMEKLIESSDDKAIGEFAVWFMEDLRQALLTKHNETFWVAANSMQISGREHFQFTKVLHTRKPIPSQFDLLFEQGKITMDHLIKRNSKGRVSEKGPLFKVDSNALELLFPPSKTYDLGA